MSLGWTCYLPNVLGSAVVIDLPYPCAQGTRPYHINLRIDAREVGQVRCDRTTVGPWEAIDGGVPHKTIEEAKYYVCAWVNAARAQGTLTPRM